MRVNVNLMAAMAMASLALGPAASLLNDMRPTTGRRPSSPPPPHTLPPRYRTGKKYKQNPRGDRGNKAFKLKGIRP